MDIAFCVKSLDGTAAVSGGGPPSPRPPKVDYKEVLHPGEFEVFSRLHDWRKATAETASRRSGGVGRIEGPGDARNLPSVSPNE